MTEEQLKNDIELRLKYASPCYECEDKDDYFYLVKEADIQRAVTSLFELFKQYGHKTTN